MKKNYALLTAALLLGCLVSGCQNETETNSVYSNIIYEPLAIPDGGWTSQELAQTIRIHGNAIEDPFTVDSLGEEYRFVDSSCCVAYHNIMSFVVAFADETNDIDDRFKQIKKIGSVEDYTDQEFTNAFTINGIGLGASREEAERAFGEPSKADGSFYQYCDDTENDYFLMIRFDEQNRVKNLFFCDTSSADSNT